MATPDLILAIDNGTQSIRAMVIDLQGNLVAKTREHFEAYYSLHPGWAEQRPDIWWEALCHVCEKLWLDHHIDKTRLTGVTVTTQRGTVINLDKLGRPLRPAMLWLDLRRSEGETPVGGLWGLLFKIAGVSDTVAYLQANAESNWLRRHQPEIWQKTHKYLLLSGYLNYRLTGRFVDSSASQIGYIPFDYKKHTWLKANAWQWDLLGIEPHLLPELKQPGEILGEISAEAAAATGIPKGLAVVAAAADKGCEILGSGGLEPSVGCLSYGTASTFSITHSKYTEPYPFIPPYPAAVPGHYSMEIQIFRGYWMVEWFKREFGYREQARAAEHGVPAEALLEELIKEIPPGSQGLILQPYWSPGLRFPGAEARGSVIGFSDYHGRAHLYRALIEGLTFALREGKEQIEKRTAIPIQSLRVSGGGSQSDVAMQITADIFGIPAARPHTFETSGVGAAIIAAVGLGLLPDFPKAVAEMTRSGKVFEPQANASQVYDRLYQEIYLKLYKRIKPLYSRLREMMQQGLLGPPPGC